MKAGRWLEWYAQAQTDIENFFQMHKGKNNTGSHLNLFRSMAFLDM